MNTLKSIKFLTIFALFIGFTSCDDDDDTTPLLAVETELVSNLHAPQSGGQGQPISGVFQVEQ